MSKFEEKFNKRRLRTSYITTIVSITLVLFMLGLLGLILLNARNLADKVKESIKISVFLKEGLSEPDILQFQKTLDASAFVKETEYITKEKAAKIVEADLGENFISVLGFNPLSSSIDIKLNAQYVNNESMAKISKNLMLNDKVKEVVTPPSLIEKVNKNIKNITLFLFGFCIIFIIIAFALINNTIRLAIYSKRLIIKSMQLVGATRHFIRWPFIFRGLIQGVISATLAIILLITILHFASLYHPEIIFNTNIRIYILIYCAIAIVGLTMAWLSTYFAVHKYLKIRTTDIF